VTASFREDQRGRGRGKTNLDKFKKKNQNSFCEEVRRGELKNFPFFDLKFFFTCPHFHLFFRLFLRKEKLKKKQPNY